MCPVTIGRWFCVGEIKMKIKIRVISELGLRIWEGELRVASGGLRVTGNQGWLWFPRSRGAAKGLFYRRGAEDAEDGPGGAGPYRGLNARIPSEKNLCGLCVSAVRNGGSLIWGRGQTPIRDCDVSGQESDSGSDPCNKKPSSRSRRVFERANDLGVFAVAAEDRKTSQSQAHQQGAGGFRNRRECGIST